MLDGLSPSPNENQIDLLAGLRPEKCDHLLAGRWPEKMCGSRAGKENVIINQGYNKTSKAKGQGYDKNADYANAALCLRPSLSSLD